MSLLDILFEAKCKRIATKLILFIETDKKIVLFLKKILVLVAYLSILTSLVKCYLGPIWSSYSNSHFHILNNIIYISIHFFTHTYFKKFQTTIFKFTHQTDPKMFLYLDRAYDFKLSP